MFPPKSKALFLLLTIAMSSSASTVMSTDVVLSTYTPPTPSLAPPPTSSVYKPVPTYAVTLCDDPACSKGNDHKLEIRTELNVCNRISHSAFFGGKGGIGGIVPGIACLFYTHPQCHYNKPEQQKWGPMQEGPLTAGAEFPQFFGKNLDYIAFKCRAAIDAPMGPW